MAAENKKYHEKDGVLFGPVAKDNKPDISTVIIATHNEEITNMAQRILRIKDGRIFQDIHNDNVVKAKDLEW